MKMAHRSKMLLSIILVITMLMSVASVGLMVASAATSASLDYSFKYENAGYAEGRIRLYAGSDADYGTYYLYWADDTKALDGYGEIKVVDLDRNFRSVFMNEFTAIPAGATKVIAIKSESAPATKTVAAASAVYEIPESKQFWNASSDMEYSFQALSDIHIQHDDSYWVYSKEHWANALEVAAKRDADFITVCGDQVNGYGYSSLEKEWPMYLKILADSSFTGPVFETNGNHEIKGNGGDLAQAADHKIFNLGSGLNVDTAAMQSNSYYEVTGPSGDHFLFMVLETSGAPNEYDEFSDAQLDWLEGLLEKYYNDGNKIIINQHALFRGYGAGDDKETPYYGGALLDSYNGKEHTGVKRLKTIMEKYPEVIMLSGHSHIDFKYNYNIDNMDGTTCYTVHIPSTSSTTHPIPGSFNAANGHGEREYIMSPDSSQGYFIDVYEDAVILNGTDLVKNEIMPLYTYMIDYSDKELKLNPDYSTDGDVYEDVTVTVDTKNLAENPASVKVSLYGADDETLTEEVVMTKNADGTFSADVSSEFTKMKFFVNAGTGESPSGEYKVNNCNVVLGGVKIEYSNPSNWSKVNVYAWNKTSNQNAAAWPGSAMTKGADGKYVALISADCKADMIIFNDGSSQTDDLAIAPYIVGTFEGSYTVVGAENPSEPDTQPTETQPTTTETQPITTEPQPTTTETQPKTEPSSTETQPTEPVDYLYGDADLDEKITVKDATLVQKHAADLLTIEGVAFIQANVSGDKAVNVRDATYIQKHVADLIDSFPIEGKEDVAEVGASGADLTALVASVKDTLSKENYYASYIAYAALKKAYYEYKDAQVSSMSADAVNDAYEVINTALTNYNTMKKNNPSHVNAGTGGTSSGGSTVAPADGAYAIRGSFNNWGNSGLEYMTKGTDGYTISYELAAGDYEFKFFNDDTDTWYGNGGTFTDNCSGWTFTDGAGNCKFTATGGTYTFKYAIESGSNKVKISVTKG